VGLYGVFLVYLIGAAGPPAPFRGALAWIHEWNVILAVWCVITGLTVYTGLLYLVENRGHVKRFVRDLFRIFLPSDV
jgi:membrane protein DedA with SNARE-associated domain